MADENKLVTLEQMYGDDLLIRNTIADNIDAFRELQELQAQLQTEEEQLLNTWREANKTRFERVAELQSMETEMWKALNAYVENQVIQTGRKQFFDRSVAAQVRKRAGEYKYGDLFAWARAHRYMDLFVIPKEPSEDLLRRLRNEAEIAFDKIEAGEADAPPVYLELDEKEAVKLAISTAPTGQRRFPKAPVPLENYVTTVSMDVFRRLLQQIMIEVEVDSRGTSHDAADQTPD